MSSEVKEITLAIHDKFGHVVHAVVAVPDILKDGDTIIKQDGQWGVLRSPKIDEQPIRGLRSAIDYPASLLYEDVDSLRSLIEATAMNIREEDMCNGVC